MRNYNKSYIKEQLSDGDIFSLLQEFGGNPIESGTAIVSDTICHNPPGEGSAKLYYYCASKIFHCYTGCDDNPSFDIFELVRKVFRIQKRTEITFDDAVRWVAQKFNIVDYFEEGAFGFDYLEDWEYLDNYERIQEIEINTSEIFLKEYDNDILKNFNYNVAIMPWLREGISREAMKQAQIGYYPGEEQITIPHFDIHGRFIGLRGRGLIEDENKRYGKYHPLKVNNVLYNHPLSMNLYNLNFAKENIPILQKAIVFESEKATLQYKSYFGSESDISVAICGSALADYQVNLLTQAGAKEIVLAFDRDFERIGDDKYTRLKTKIERLAKKHSNKVLVSAIWDKKLITGVKASPIDEGPNKFLQLYKDRIIF